MSRKERGLGSIPSPYSYLIIGVDSASNLVGRLLTLVETLGLRETQENAVKDTVRNMIWDWYHDKVWHSELTDEEAKTFFQKKVPVNK